MGNKKCKDDYAGETMGNKKCKDDYVGETGRRKTIRTGEHAGKDKQSEILKHTKKTKHPRAKKK